MKIQEEMRSYELGKCISFRKTTERYGGLSNMASDYSIVVNGIFIRSSEALYQAIRFTHLPQVQKEIIAQTSPMTAKMIAKKYKSQTRSDWESIKLSVMRWILRVKLVQNKTTFGKLLLSTENLPIVEESRKDEFWGAKLQDDKLVGINALGRLLMELREIYMQKEFGMVVPLKIADFKLFGQDINGVYSEDKQRHELNDGLFQ